MARERFLCLIWVVYYILNGWTAVDRALIGPVPLASLRALVYPPGPLGTLHPNLHWWMPSVPDPRVGPSNSLSTLAVWSIPLLVQRRLSSSAQNFS